MSLRFAFASIAAILCTAACGNQAAGVGGEELGSVSERIVGGGVDTTHTGVVSTITLFSGASLVGYCSGTLLAPNLVLTARHCISLKSGALTGPVTCGVTKFTTTGTGDLAVASPATVRPADPHSSAFYQASEFHVAPGNSDVCGDDVALIILGGPGIPANLSKPIPPRIDSPPTAGESFSALGYGFSEPGDGAPDGTRMRADGFTVTCEGLDCSTRDTTVSPTEWASADARLCEGDSGGPALDSEGRVMGVASRAGQGCTGGIYSDVASFKDFIVSTAVAAANLGGYDPPSWTGAQPAAPDAQAAPKRDGGAGVAAATPPLGESCTGDCSDGYACYSANGASEGVCVPRCTADSVCPATYTCNTALGVCAPPGSASSHSSGGCTVSETPLEGDLPSLAAGSIAVAALLRRRRNSGA